VNRPNYRRMTCGASIFLFAGLQGGMGAGPVPQKAESMNLTFSIYSTDHDQSLTAIRLIAFRDEPSLVESHVAELVQSLSVRPLSQPGAKPILTWQLQPRMGMAQWDALSAGQNAIAAISTDPGSRRCPLSYGVSDRQGEIQLTQKYPMGVFQKPRFVKGRAGTEAAVASVRSDARPASVVVFSAALPAEGAVAEIPIASGILERALIVRSTTGYLLFYKILGPSVATRIVKSLNGGIRPGPLFCLRLDAHFHPLGHPARLEPSDVFEFDADAGHGRVILFATTAEGFRIGIGIESDGGSLPTWSWRDAGREEQLESPAVLLQANRIYLAAIETPLTGPSKILTLDSAQ
jgi:hypothetical protein